MRVVVGGDHSARVEARTRATRHGDPSVDAVRLRAVTALHADPQGAIGAA